MVAADPFDAIPPRQMEALTIRFGENWRHPTPYRMVAERMGISHPAAIKLIRRGLRNVADTGLDLSCLFVGASPENR